LGALDEKSHKDDEVGKNEVQYDVVQEEYDFSASSILEQLKQKAAEVFGIVQQKTSEIVENALKKLEKQKRMFVQLYLKQNRRLLRL
jgi:hypothetical protein